MKLLSLRDCVDVLVEAEARFPVNEWRAGPLRIWPLVRWLLYQRSTTAEPAPGKAVGRLLRSLGSAADSVHAPFRDAGRNLPAAAPADAFFLTYSFARQAAVDGRHVDVYADPLIEALRDSGRSSHVWEYSHIEPYRLPRAGPSYLAQRKLLAGWLRSRFVDPCPRELSLDGYGDFRARLEAGGLFPRDLEPDRLRRRISNVLAMKAVFSAALRGIRPRAAFVSSASTFEFGLLLACREAGVRSIEIQHGAQGPLHAHYARWTAVPPEGYDLLPDAYWSWDDESARAINAWSARSAPRHRAVAGGIPWRERGRELDPARLDPRHRGLLDGAAGRKVLLLSLQPPGLLYADGAPIPCFIADAIRRAPPDWSWWIRLHPLMPRDTRPIRAALSGARGPVEIEGPSELPLHALLPRTDLHLTHSSSVVLDALEFGVSSIVWSDLGADLFARPVEEGSCLVARTPEELLEAARRLLDRGKSGRSAARAPLRETLERLMEGGMD
jgi:hypothetical protein